jgi:NAD(P)-dependent dehydrogenase (short-subunit alcohol dehydrogenase family)
MLTLITHDGIVAKAVATCGRLDCLVNNAGVSVLARGDILDVKAESFDRCAAINAKALFFLTQAVARHFLASSAGTITAPSSRSPRPAPWRSRSIGRSTACPRPRRPW